MVECHIFPEGNHGIGLATGDDEVSKHVSQWGALLVNWLKYISKKVNVCVWKAETKTSFVLMFINVFLI